MKIDEPGQIGDVHIRNRLVMAPMISNLANPDGNTNENHMLYLEKRAEGGAGLIITEYAYINPINSKGSRNQLGIFSDDYIPKLRRLTERIHRWNTKIFAQLVHAGGKALKSHGERAVSPSPVSYPGGIPDEISEDEISLIVDDFAKSAVIAERANFDGIEIHGAHGYLVQEFISPSLNRREDKYGRDFRGRLRFPQEIIDRIRECVSIPVGIRLSLYEDDEGGYGPDYGINVAESLNGIDYVHFSAGRFSPPGSSASFYSPRTHIFLRMPRKPNLTTIVVGSVTSKSDAELVLSVADFVSLGRALLADPYFPKKVISNVIPRPCIRCNQACRDLSYGEVRCTVNPETGFESTPLPFYNFKGEIDIIGGGVQGMEAAIYGAKCGLKVTIHEKNDRIGGQLLDLYDPLKKKEFSRLLDYYAHVMQKLGISIELNDHYISEGLYCLPLVEYPEIKQSDKIIIDSNIYRYQDDAMRLSLSSDVYITKRSIEGLDRSRREAFSRNAIEMGVRFIDNSITDRYSVSHFEKNQYDIREAMVSGRSKILHYIQENMNLFL